MDSDRFDQIARFAASSRSRRGMLKSLAGGTLGAVAAAAGLSRAAAAGRKRSVGNSCRVNSDCASILCVQESRTRKICHCRSFEDCPANPPCSSAICGDNGHCATQVNVGAQCDDGDICTTDDVCQENGACAGTAVVCTAPNECYTAGACSATTAGCPAATYNGDGATCSTGVCYNEACCTPDTVAATCQGKVPGSQTNNCGQTVYCGTITMSFSPTGDSAYCNVAVSLASFAPSTQYNVICTTYKYGPEDYGPYSYTTDASGASGPNGLFSYSNQGVSIECKTGGLTSGVVPITCPAG